MASLLRPVIIRYSLPNGSTRTADGRRVTKNTPGAVRRKRKAKQWYGQYVNGAGIERRVPLSANKTAAQQLLNELVRKAELGKIGVADPFEAHRRRPVAEHLADFAKELSARGNAPRYVELVVSRLHSLLYGCRFVFLSDLSASRAMDWLADLRRKGRERLPLEEGKQKYTMREAAAILGIKPGSLAIAVKRYRLQATGQGRAVAPRDGRSAAKPPLPRDQHADEQLLPVQCQVLLPLAGEGPARAR